MAATTAVSAQQAVEPKTTVGVCTKHDDLRERIAAALALADLTASHESDDTVGAIRICEEGALDLIVIGARRPDAATQDTIRSLMQAIPTVRVIITCERAAAGDVRKALAAGAMGVILVDELEEALQAVLQVVRAGQVSVPVVHGKEASEQILTMREKQILGLVVMGMTNAQIASKLYLAESTVKSHLSSSFAKLGVASRNEAVTLILDPARGQGLGILTIPAEKMALRSSR